LSAHSADGQWVIPSSSSRDLAELAETLAAERNVLDYLVFKLVEARLVLIADEARFIPQAMAEVDAVIAQIRRGESHRQHALVRLARHIGVPPDSLTLARLADSAPEPYGLIFSDYQRQFYDLTTEIERLTHENRRLASQSVSSIRAALSALIGPAGPVDVYTAAGEHAGAPSVKPLRVDEIL
jgi:hypothetical protein